MMDSKTDCFEHEFREILSHDLSLVLTRDPSKNLPRSYNLLPAVPQRYVIVKVTKIR
jgi:hypothetical protein